MSVWHLLKNVWDGDLHTQQLSCFLKNSGKKITLVLLLSLINWPKYVSVPCYIWILNLMSTVCLISFTLSRVIFPLHLLHKNTVRVIR
jgi:hypothetical protein